MGTQSPKLVYYSRECRDKSPRGTCPGRKKELEVRNFDARRVSRSILHEILGEMHKVNHDKPRTPCKIIKIQREIPIHIHKQQMPEPRKVSIPLNEPSSMSGLIVWNVSKALQMTPCLNLKSSIKEAEQRLKSDERDLSVVNDKHPEQQHLLCALLAWHQMGHHHADSLYKFVKPKLDEKCGAAKCDSKPNTTRIDSISIHEANNTKNVCLNPVWKNLKPSDNGSFGSHTSGPIVALPVEPKFIMRVDKDGCCGRNPPKAKRTSRADSDLACCGRKAKPKPQVDDDLICCGLRAKSESRDDLDQDQDQNQDQDQDQHQDQDQDQDQCQCQAKKKDQDECTAKKKEEKDQDQPCCSQIPGCIGKIPMPKSSPQDVTGTEKESQDKLDKPDEPDKPEIPDGVCCLDQQCVETLAALDAKTNELRARAFQLAQHEGTRVQLLDRAEVAWTDLEAGYQRQLEEEKGRGRDMEKQAKSMITERNFCKIGCKSLADDLTNKKEGAEQAKQKLTELENEVIELAATRLHKDEEAAKGEAALAEELARVLQYERDLKFNEDQASRKFESLMNEADTARALACEVERSMRAELAALRDQIETISKHLAVEEEETEKNKTEHDQLRSEKKELIEDLEACKSSCDKKMQNLLEELKEKKKKLLDLQELVLECRCKVPTEATVQVTRTASLAALCRCTPEENFLESCSCTSLRSKLLSDLLAELFGGLQAELGVTGWRMPCQMLKCLEDQHSWEKPSVIKTNLRNFFSKLLKSELDIAIATSIERYHARWIGASCADAEKMEPTLDDDLKEGWQDRAIERRAQLLANKLVQNLYKERSKQPCDCDPAPSSNCKIAEQSKKDSQPQQAALFPCLLPPNSPFIRAATTPAVYQQATDTPPAFWKKTIQDVTQLKVQIEDLKKDSIKKEDLKVMEENISKIVREASVMEKEDSLATTKDNSNIQGERVKKEIKNSRVVNNDESPKASNQNKLGTARRKDNKGLFKKGAINEKPSKQSKKAVPGQLYAVNLCLGGPQKNTKSFQNAKLSNSEKSTWKQNSLKSILQQSSTVKQIKPININHLSPDLQENNCNTSELCDSNFKCFHKTPSSASIDRLLQTLVSWNHELAPQDKCVKNYKRSSSKCSETTINQTLSKLNQNDSTLTTSNYKKQVYDSDINNDMHSMKADQQNGSFIKQPITTESEYMGTVYLDKSHENICKCVANIESNKEYNCEKYDDGEEKIPFQCINTHTCDCKILKKMQKDHKRSQTIALNLQTQSINYQGAQSKDYPEFDEFQHKPETSSNINDQKEVKQKSTMQNVPLKTELYSNNSEYFIKFLGVTLDNLSSDKNKNIKIKPVEHEPPRKFPKKLSDMDKSNSLTKPFFLTKERTGFNDCTKCECEAKFEEFSSAMTNILDKKLHENLYKDEVIDPQNVKCAVDKTIESCVCCNGVNVGDSRDLEVNAFHLLEDHMKEKIKEFKRFSCIPPEEEEKLFSTILQRVKQVISDCANKMKCGCPGGLPNNGSWNRAYGLLQEYLKIKIKRVQCLCVMNDRKDVILPEVLDKVCNLIESDFKRLKDIYCTCENNTDTRTNIARIGDLVLPPPTELPEKDTNTSQANYYKNEIKKCAKNSKLSKQNSNNSMIIKENISSQVTPYLGMEAKSCDIMKPSSNTNARTTETDQIITDSKSNGIMFNTCDCSHNTDKVDIMNFPDMFGTKEVLVNLYTEQAVNTSDIYDYSLVSTYQETSKCLLAGGVESTKQISNIENNKNYEKNLITQKRMINSQTPHAPYIGYTVECSCDDALGSCFCMKSVVQSNNDKIDHLWKGFLVNDKKQFSYIMHGNPNQNNSDVVVNCHSISKDSVIDQASTTAITNDDILTCEAEILTENVDDLILKCSLENVDLVHHAANTVDVESSSLETAYSNNDFFSIDWIKSPLPAVSGRSHAIKLTNSIYFPGIPIDNDENSFISGTTTDFDTQITSESCVCDKVPICHVKMLVEHIEKNLVESKCTCDTLISKVCPLHSKRGL